MSETKHTPGPWYVENNPDGRTGTRIRTESVKLPNAKHGVQIARIFKGMGYEQDEANARLIASAPCMRKRLEDMADRIAAMMRDYELPEECNGIISGELDATNELLKD